MTDVPQLVTCNSAAGVGTLALAAPAAPLVDVEARTIAGLAVPFGPVGSTSAGRLQFSAGSLTWSSASRVKLLREHDQRDAVGVASSFDELTAAQVDARMAAAGRDPIGLAGLWAVFRVPEGENGDRALAEAANGLRDAFSVGVQLDDKSLERLRRAQGAAVQGSGALRETSLVSVPAFDDARVGAVAANAQLSVGSWTPTPTGDATVRCSTCHHVHAAGVTACQSEHVEAAQAALAAAAATSTATGTPATAPAQPATETAAPPPSATAGNATVTGEAATYGFSADGPSLVADAWAARMYGDGEAAGRLHRFNAELVDGNAASVNALAAVLKTTDTGVDSPAPVVVAPNVRRPDLLREAIDRGRPLLSRLNPVPINNAQPFLIPVEGEFDGVAEHVEGTAHAPEGTLTMGDATMSPKALSGAFRLSREIVDSSNPAIDRIALRAMLRDYRRKSEARALAALLVAAGAAVPVAGPVALDVAILGFGNDDSDEPDLVAGSKLAIQNLATYLDADGRQLLPPVNAVNAPGTRRAGSTGYSIGGAELAKSSSITGTDVLVIDSDSVLAAESRTQTFRFDEVEGPGVIKLALFGYLGVAVLDTVGVERYSVAAYTPPAA